MFSWLSIGIVEEKINLSHLIPAAVEHREHSTGVTRRSPGLQKHRNHNTLPNMEPPLEL